MPSSKNYDTFILLSLLSYVFNCCMQENLTRFENGDSFNPKTSVLPVITGLTLAGNVTSYVAKFNDRVVEDWLRLVDT